MMQQQTQQDNKSHFFKNHGARKLALVTGASSGIGYELAKVSLEKGYDVFMVADEPEIFERAQSLEGLQGETIPMCADLSNRKEVESVYGKLQSLDRPVDALMLNAAVAVSGDFVRENKLEDELKLLHLNIVSVVHLAKLILPSMVERNQGRVLVSSSIAALMPGPLYATYAASKAFLLSFAEAIHNELQDTDVGVTALLPGPTETEFFTRSGMEDTNVGQSQKDDPAEVARQGFEAMLRNDDRILAGSMSNKMQGIASRFMTDQQKAAQHRKMTEPARKAN